MSRVAASGLQPASWPPLCDTLCRVVAQEVEDILAMLAPQVQAAAAAGAAGCAAAASMDVLPLPLLLVLLVGCAPAASAGAGADGWLCSCCCCCCCWLCCCHCCSCRLDWAWWCNRVCAAAAAAAAAAPAAVISAGRKSECYAVISYPYSLSAYHAGRRQHTTPVPRARPVPAQTSVNTPRCTGLRRWTACA